MSSITMRDLFKAGVHYGHRARNWNPQMAPYIYGEQNKIHVINLEKTLPMYQDAANFLGSVASKGGKILFVGTKRAAQAATKKYAEQMGMPYVSHRWLGGMLTNYKTVRQSIRRLREIEKMRDEGIFEKLTKKEAMGLTRELEKLERSLGGIKNMGGIPDAVVLIDSSQEKIAIAEARRLSIPVVGIVDTNGSPNGIDYLIPGNDDAMRAIELYFSGFAEVVGHAKTAARVRSTGRADVEADQKNHSQVAQQESHLEADASEASGSNADASDEQN